MMGRGDLRLDLVGVKAAWATCGGELTFVGALLHVEGKRENLSPNCPQVIFLTLKNQIDVFSDQ